MPIYEYECQGCRYRFELKASIDDRHLKKCPKCGEIPVIVIYPVPHYWAEGAPA